MLLLVEEDEHDVEREVNCPYCGEPMKVVIHTMPPPIGHCPKCEEKCDACREFLEAQDLSEAVGMVQNVGTSQQVPTNRATEKEVIVTLTPEEIERAEQDGAARSRYARDNNLTHRSTVDPEKALKRDMIGAVCEYAAHVGLKVIGIEVPYNPSVGVTTNVDMKIYEVRGNTTTAGRLRINRGSEKPNTPWIHVIDQRPQFILAGWAWGREVTVEKYWGDHGYKVPCWGMPRSDLHPMREIPRPRDKSPEPEPGPDGDFNKAPGYAEMMKRLKGGA